MRIVVFLFMISISCFVLFVGCKPGHAETITVSDTAVLQRDSIQFYLKDSSGLIKFPELTVRFNINPGFKLIMRESKDPNDTLDLAMSEPGEAFDGRTISIVSDKLLNMTVEQRYRNTVMISNEGEHIDLVSWKRYDSEWSAPVPVSNSGYKWRSYSAEEDKRFPKVSMNELRTYLLTTPEYGRKVAEVIKQAKSINDHPLDVGTSMQFLRIRGTRKDNGVRISKVIILRIDRGC